MSSIAHELAAVLRPIRTPGDFYAPGTIDLPLPLLTVQGVGRSRCRCCRSRPNGSSPSPSPIAHLTAAAKRRSSTWPSGGRGRSAPTACGSKAPTGSGHCSPSSNGRPRGWAWPRPQWCRNSKLLVYDEGSFFVKHRDTEKATGMFATLVVALPSVHAGGDLLVHHEDRAACLDLRSPDPSRVVFAAFHADCVHAVLPVTSGCRLTPVHNLLRKGGGRPPEPPSHDAGTARVAALLARWVARKQVPGDETPEKLVCPLEHACTPAELSSQALKGPDAAAAAAARQSGCDLHAALLTVEESGSAEHSSDFPRSWRDHGGDEDDDGDGDGDGDDGDDELERSARSATAARRRPSGAASTAARPISASFPSTRASCVRRMSSTTWHRLDDLARPG